MKHLFQNLANNLPGIVYRVFIREGHRIRFFNRAAEKITGYNDSELSGGAVCGIECLILPEDRGEVIDEVSLAVRENRPFTVEYRIKHRDGVARYLLEQGTPVYGEDGEPLYIDGVIFDMTGQRLAEEALAEARREKERTKADFNLVNHDLKSPVTVLNNYVEMLDGLADAGETREVVEGIRNSARRIIKMVEEFQAVFELTTGPVKVNPFVVNISEIVLEAKELSGPPARKKGLGLEAVVKGGKLTAVADGRLVARAVSNLIQNAVKYTRAGGKVNVEAGPDEGGRHICISVSDTGPGIPAGEQAKVFGKYYRMQRDSHTKGSGLGLFIVKAVAEAHGGWVELSSAPGKGCTFRILLPVGTEGFC